MLEEIQADAPPSPSPSPSPTPPPADCPASWEERLARPMFTVALLFLVVLAGLFHRLPREEIFEWERESIEGALVVLWLLVIAEAVFRWLRRPPETGLRQAVGQFLLIALLPPLRLGVPGQTCAGRLWLPYLGWREIDASLRKSLERFYSVPMIVIACMILPLLLIDYKWREVIVESPGLSLVFDIGVSVIWLAFAIEFIVMVSAADSGWRYCLFHWIDLAIVVLPVFEALPLAGLLQKLNLLRLEQISRMGRLYRLQALAMKAWRSFLILDVIQRLIGRSLEKRLESLQELLHVKEEEVAQLRKELAELQERLVQEKPPEPTPDTVPETAIQPAAEEAKS